MSEQRTIFDQDRDGATFDPERDGARLNAQHRRVYQAMLGGDGFFTLAQIAEVTGDPEASVSARLRDFRKARFGGHKVERLRGERGTWFYRLIWNEAVPRPVFDE